MIKTLILSVIINNYDLINQILFLSKCNSVMIKLNIKFKRHHSLQFLGYKPLQEMDTIRHMTKVVL